MDERTTEILNRFETSWNDVETFYDNFIENYPGFERVQPIRQYITYLKRKEYHQFFRLGTSVHTLIISRSVNHGLRPDQKHIRIDPFDHYYQVSLQDGNKIYREYRIESLEDEKLTKLLRTLKGTLVD